MRDTLQAARGAAPRWLASLAAGVLSLVAAASAPAADKGLIIGNGGASDEKIRSYMEAKGLVVTTIAPLTLENTPYPDDVVPDSLTQYKVVWDNALLGNFSGFVNRDPLGAKRAAVYQAYLQAGGSLFLVGDNQGYAGARLDSIRAFIDTVGGGSLPQFYGASTPRNGAQNVVAPFTGPETLSAVSAFPTPPADSWYPCLEGLSTTAGTGAFISTRVANSAEGSSIVWRKGSLSNAATGTMILVLDQNHSIDNCVGLPGFNANNDAFIRNLLQFLIDESEITAPSVECAGFMQPVDRRPTTNRANAGRTIPLRWTCTREGEPVSTPPDSFGVTSTSCPSEVATSTATDAIEEYSNGNGLTYHGNGVWQFNWATPRAYAGSCRSTTVNFDGAELSADFRFVR